MPDGPRGVARIVAAVEPFDEIAVVLGVSFVLGLVVAIVMGVQIGNIDSQLGIQSDNSAAGNCVSQGGTNPGC